MNRKNILTIVGTSLTGLASLVGCRNTVKVNLPPEIHVSEVDGTPVNSIRNDEIVSNDSCDEIYLLAIPRGNLENNELGLMVHLSDPEKRLVTFNPYSTREPGNNNPISIRYSEVDASINESSGEKYEINAHIEVIADEENTSLGAHHAFDISYSDGFNNGKACFYDIPVPGTTIPPGEIPQIDDQQPQSELDKLVDWACTNLPRAKDNSTTTNINEGSDLRLFIVPSGTSSFKYTENGELFASQYHHRTDASIKGYRVLTAGTSLGDIMEMTDCISGRPDDNTCVNSLEDGYNPSKCSHIYILNRDGGTISTQSDITVWADGENGLTAEVIRPY